MTKQILSAAVIATLTLAGCSQMSQTADAVTSTAKSATEKVTSGAKSVTEKVTSTAKSATEKVTGAVESNTSVLDANVTTMKVDAPEASLKVGDVVETKIDDASASATATLPTSSSMTDMATDKVVEVADAKTDGAASKVIDAVK